jgi:LytS/YehU family sensor histidine kinase
LQFISEIEEETLRIQIPPMIIQMVENAIKHGISQLKHGGIVEKIKKKIQIYIFKSIIQGNCKRYNPIRSQKYSKKITIDLWRKRHFSLSEVENEVIHTITLPIS